MDRVAKLITASTSLRRQIWASMPFGVRVADFFSRLAVSTTEAFGATVYAEFLKNSVEGMPEIGGTVPDPKRVPRGYGRDFGKKAYAILMSKLHNPQRVEDVMSEFLIRFIERGSTGLRPGTSIKEAENYVLKGLVRLGYNSLRNSLRKREVSDTLVYDRYDAKSDTRMDFPSFDDSHSDSLRSIFEDALPSLQGRLKAIHPDASRYIELSLDGYTDREIIGDIAHGTPSMLSDPYSLHGTPLNEKAWQAGFKPKILNLFKRALNPSSVMHSLTV